MTFCFAGMEDIDENTLHVSKMPMCVNSQCGIDFSGDFMYIVARNDNYRVRLVGGGDDDLRI